MSLIDEEVHSNDRWRDMRHRVASDYHTRHRRKDLAQTEHSLASYALAWAEMRCLHTSTFLDDLLYTSDINEHALGVVGSRDGNSLCDQRAGVEVMAGYLARRYQYGGECMSAIVQP